MKTPLAWIRKRPEWYGFVIGAACLALTAAAYRLTWEIPPSAWPNQQDLVIPPAANVDPETEEQAALETGRRAVPLQRIDPPPHLRRPRAPEPSAQAAAPPQPSAPAAAPPPPARPAAPPRPVTVRRSVVQRGFAPGVPVDIQITIDKGDETAVQMLVLEETLPPGWTFLRAESDAPPDAQPTPNTGATLQFAWREPPAFPLILRYTLMPNPQHTTPQALRARLTYQVDGATRTSPGGALVVRPAAAAPPPVP